MNNTKNRNYKIWIIIFGIFNTGLFLWTLDLMPLLNIDGKKSTEVLTISPKNDFIKIAPPKDKQFPNEKSVIWEVYKKDKKDIDPDAPHSIEETNHPLPDDQGIIEDNWAMHQIRTTANFSKKSKFLTWYLGGLNYQIEHHLFPNICHIHYPNIAPIVKKTAEEYELPYVEHKTFVKALESHIGLMRKIA